MEALKLQISTRDANSTIQIINNKFRNLKEEKKKSRSEPRAQFEEFTGPENLFTYFANNFECLLKIRNDSDLTFFCRI